MKAFVMAAAFAALSGCITAPQMLPGDRYLVDTEQGMMCHVGRCYYLSLIQPSFDELRIARAYGLPVQNYSWSTEQLVKLMLQPPGEAYPVTRLSDTEYSLPINTMTEAAYLVLEDEYNQLYKSGNIDLD